jgi:hypothetical protein
VRRSPITLLGLGFALLAFAWMMSNQPFASPDEAAHYLRALNIANGHLLGPKLPYPLRPPTTPQQRAFVQGNARGVMVPARLSPPNTVCVNGRPDIRGSCTELSYEGNFPPLPYLLPAVALDVSHDVSTASWLTRLAAALQSLAFLLLALALLWGGTASSIVGLAVAATPMVLFVSSILNPSGLEIASSIAFVASVLRITRDPVRVARWCWIALAASGAVAILAWPLGLAFAAGYLVLSALLLGRDGLRELYGKGGRELRVSATVLSIAAAVAVVYSRVSGLGEGRFSISPIGSGIRAGLDQLVYVLKDSVGHFGSLTVALPLAAYWIWWLIIVALVLVALAVGAVKERVLMLVVVLASLAFPVLFYAWFVRFTGFGLQGRELLPGLIGVPMLAGEIVHRHRAAIAGRILQPVIAAVLLIIALFQGYAWWYNARTTAGAPGTIRFYAHATYAPPLGWGPWIAFAAAGVLAIVSFAATQATTSAGGLSGQPADAAAGS